MYVSLMVLYAKYEFAIRLCLVIHTINKLAALAFSFVISLPGLRLDLGEPIELVRRLKYKYAVS